MPLDLSAPSLNGPGRPQGRRNPSRKKAAVTATPVARSRIGLILTVALGVAIPLLSLSLSKIAGSLALVGHYALAGFALLLCLSVLAVSLGHLAWAVENITRSSVRASWALAITIDLALVLGESVQVFAGEGLMGITTAVMTAVCLFSMALNVWAFLRHPAP